MATYTLGLYSNSSFVNMYTGATYTGGMGAPFRIENDQAHIQNITVTDTQTGTSNTANYNNDNLSGTEGIETISANNEDQLNGGAYTSQQTIDTFVATDGTVYNDVAIVAGESYRVGLYDALSGGTKIDSFWVTSVYIDLDGDGVKDANEDEYFVSSRDLSTIPESYRVDFETYNTSSDALGGISSGYVTAAETSTAIAGEVDGTSAGEVMDIGYTDAQGDIIDGADGINDTIHGNGGDDTINAGQGRDSVLGGDGNDSIQGGAERDTIRGGEGNDTIFGGANDSDWLFGDAGDDTIVGGTGDNVADYIWGGTGNDNIDGGGGDDVLRGEDGNATIDGGSGSDTIEGGAGDDYIFQSQNNGTPYDNQADSIDAGTGNDTIQSSFGNDTIDGGDGIDLYDASNFGQAASIDLNAGTGSFAGTATTAQSLSNIENVYTGFGDDYVAGSDVANLIEGNSGNDTLLGRGGDDTLHGGTGNDIFYGGDDNDVLYGDEGDDTLYAQAGDDTLFGGDGNDIMGGGPGDDVLTGGDGDDTFINTIDNDIITDFNAGNTGSITDGDQTNNDFVDLSGYYNQTNYDAAVAAGDIDPTVIKNPLQWMRADQEDDGILNDTNAGWSIDNTLIIQNGGSAVAGSDLTFDNTNVVCFARGTLIKTINGEIPVEDLSTGDRVLTVDNGYQPVRWIGARKFSSEQLAEHKNLRPVRIRAGALGNGLPETDLLVSQQHRILICSKIAQRMFDGHSEVLVAAKHLVLVDGIDIVESDGVEYYHFLFDNHQVVFSNGARTESMYTGPEALKTVSPEARKEILTIFPEVAHIDYEALSCRPLANGRMGRKLAMRHKNNSKQLFAENGL